MVDEIILYYVFVKVMKAHVPVEIWLHGFLEEVVFSFTLRLLYPRGKNQRYPLNRKLFGLKSTSELFGENSLTSAGNQSRFLGRTDRSLVTVPTTQGAKILSNTSRSLHLLFLVTDGR